MNRLQDDLLADIFRQLSLHERARLASVCRRWRRVSTNTHAAVVWRTLCVDENALGRGASIYYGSLVRWCHARGRHIRELEFHFAQGGSHAEFEVSNSPGGFRLLTSLSPILLTASSQLQRLSVLPWDDDADFGLLRPLMSMVSMAPSLEYLAVEIPFNRGIGPLAESVPSLRHLKVADVTYYRGVDEVCDTAAAEELARTLCRCPLLVELKLWHFYFGCLPAELAAATQLTSLVLSDPRHSQLDITNALPCSLQQLRLTESDDPYDQPDDGDEPEMVTRDFGSLTRMQCLQLAAHEWAATRLPLGLTALRLEAADRYAGLTPDIMIGGISSLVSLEHLCLDGFAELGKWPAEVAATLRPLHRLRALGLDYCSFQENPAKDILTRLTLLSLSGNQLNALPHALPAETVHNLRLLDISHNALSNPQPAGGVASWAAENILAFDSGWASLQVLGMQSMIPSRVDPGLRATAKVVQRLLQRQADAAEPRRPPAIVVCDTVHEELLRPARELAVVT